MRIDHILYKSTSNEYIYALNEILSTAEAFVVPKKQTVRHLFSTKDLPITHIGYRISPDTRSEHERLEDEYRFYYPPTSLEGIEVPVPKSVKKIIIPNTITNISDQAFKSLSGVTFEIEDGSPFEFDGKRLIVKNTGVVLYENNCG